MAGSSRVSFLKLVSRVSLSSFSSLRFGRSISLVESHCPLRLRLRALGRPRLDTRLTHSLSLSLSLSKFNGLSSKFNGRIIPRWILSLEAQESEALLVARALGSRRSVARHFPRGGVRGVFERRAIQFFRTRLIRQARSGIRLAKTPPRALRRGQRRRSPRGPAPTA